MAVRSAGASACLSKSARDPSGTVRLSYVDATTVAAFAAAVLSLVNVAVTVRLAHGGQREQWRREQERPIVARCAALSVDIRDQWREASFARLDLQAPVGAQLDIQQRVNNGWQALRNLRYEVAQLDLLASPTVRQAARDLVAAHEQEMTRLAFPVNPAMDENAARLASHAKIGKLEEALVERTRTDLGLAPAGSSAQPRSRGLVGGLLARDAPQNRGAS